MIENKLAIFLMQKLFLETKPNVAPEIAHKVQYYCTWLDSLEVESVMIFSSPSLDVICFCYALALKNKTYIPIHTSTAPELVISYLSTFAVDMLIIGNEFISIFDTAFQHETNKEEASPFFYYRTVIQKPFCWLPGMVFFTSGTTELPKVVHYTYEVIYNYINWCVNEFKLQSQDHVLFTTELSFIASLRPLFLPLLAGAKIFFLENQKLKVDFILKTIAQKKITILNCTPSLLNILIKHIEQSSLHLDSKWVRLIILSGEPLDSRVVNYWLEFINQSTVFYSLYGATEFLVPFYKRIIQPLAEEESFHLGHIRPGSSYKLDFVPGKGYELFITGGVATGYFDASQMEKSYFFLEGKRYIKTHDCVKLIGDKLYYQTRTHRLVKRYGQIINLDQIEYLLRKHYPLYNFAVVANEHEENKIALFIETQTNNDLLDAIQLNLRHYLPSYMHPSEYHFLEDIPRTSSGKTDYYLIKKRGLALKKNGVFSYFKKFFPNQEIDFNAYLMNLGLESIDYIELSQQCLKQTGKWLDNSKITKLSRIADLPSYLIPVHFTKTRPKTAVKVHPALVWYYLQNRREIYLASYFCLNKSIDFHKLESAISQTIEHHFMLSCKIIRINEEYFFEKTNPQSQFWLKKPFFKKKLSQIKVFTHSERLVYIYLQRKKDQTYLIIAFNHIALDGWSVVLLREEIFCRYEDYKKTIPKCEEIESLNKINDIWLPCSLNELEQELKKVNISDYNPVDKLFNEPLVTRNTSFSIAKEKIEQFIARNRLGHIPYSVLFALVLQRALFELSKQSKLMVYVTFSHRNLPIEGIKILQTNLATSFPVFFNSEHKTLSECAQELQNLFTLYFKNMHYSAAAELWNKQIIDRKYLSFIELPHVILYSYINKITDIDYIQNKYIDWENSIYEFHAPKKLGVHFRVYNLDTQCAMALTTMMNLGLHEQILNYIHRIF